MDKTTHKPFSRGVNAMATSSKTGKSKNTKKTLRRGLIRLKDETIRDRFMVYFDEELGERLRLYCTKSRRQISDVMAEAVETYLKKKKA